jgi:hypothetical protein
MHLRSASVLAALVFVALLPRCSSATTTSGGCPDGTLDCDSTCCPDAAHYACVSGQCQLTSCDQDYQLCGKGCITITANCCDAKTGVYCQTGEVCCGSGCIPIGTSCCGDGRFCPVGKVCCGNDMCC